jgi:hypothetical protein
MYLSFSLFRPLFVDSHSGSVSIVIVLDFRNLVVILHKCCVAVPANDKVGHENGRPTGPIVRLGPVSKNVLGQEKSQNGQREHETRCEAQLFADFAIFGMQKTASSRTRTHTHAHTHTPRKKRQKGSKMKKKK